MKNNYNYDMNIENSRASGAQNMNINHNPYINQNMNNQVANNGNNPKGQNGFSNGDFLKGALVGAAVTFILTNKGAQESLMKAASKCSELFQAGMEELKERYEDAQAAMEANRE
jgi:hypothetical protein